MAQQIVANELLAFLQQKLDVMDEISAVQICVSNFSEDDIAAAKRLLFTVLNKADQMVSRRRDGTKKSVQDIITLFKETDPDDVPTFVAKDLNKLPPVTFDHVDVTSLLKDIVVLKASLADVKRQLDASQNIVADLRKELVDLRNAVTISGSLTPSASNVNMRRGAGLDLSFASAVLMSSPRPTAESAECVVSAPRSSVPPPPPSAAPPCIAARVDRPDPVHVTAVPAKQRRNKNNVAICAAAAPSQPLPEVRPSQADDGFITVQRKKNRRIIKNRCGKAAVEPTAPLRAAKPNTPVYISRLHYTTKAEDIVDYVRQKIKYTPRVQKLESRRNVNFLAFVVRIPNCFLHLVMDENFWPQGVVFRRFRGQVPPDRTQT